MGNKTCEKCLRDPYKFDRAEYDNLSEKYLCTGCSFELNKRHHKMSYELIKSFFVEEKFKCSCCAYCECWCEKNCRCECSSEQSNA